MTSTFKRTGSAASTTRGTKCPALGSPTARRLFASTGWGLRQRRQCRPTAVKSGHQFRLPQERDAARVQLVPNNVYRVAAIDQRRDRASETRLYFASPIFIPQQ